MDSFIRGQVCEDYCKFLDDLKTKPSPQLRLSEHAFRSWQVHNSTIVPRRLYNADGELELSHN